MFCYQCQEAAQGLGCTVKGVCGKTPEVAGLQDLLIYQLKGISLLTKTLRTQGVEVSFANRFVVDGLFMTITNANFDYDRFVSTILKGFEIREKLKTRLTQLNVALPDTSNDILTWTASSAKEMEA
jgi:hydroxylamine reductase